MCGIAGIVASTGAGVPGALSALQRIRHRGPDDEGLLVGDWKSGSATAVSTDDSDPRLNLPHWKSLSCRNWGILMGHRRLSILDLSVAGHQPMASRSGRFWITYNGEVYNYLEIRQQLEAEGFSFHSQSDTEVVIAAYERWGDDCVKRFRGMWAFCIWDTVAKTLFLSRDPFGIKPLYYALKDGCFYFCSEVKGLLELIQSNCAISPAEACEYLVWGMTERPHSRTIVQGVMELPPASYAKINIEQGLSFTPRKYWHVELVKPRAIQFDDAAMELRRLFEESIRMHLRSDVPVGAALSGGIDSSGIVCAVREAAGPALNLHTFSFIAEDPRISEESWMDLIGSGVGATMHKVFNAGEDLEGSIEALIECQDIPFGSTSIYAQHRVFRLAAEAGIKVTLDGQGPDEMFGGYFHYRLRRAASLISRGRLVAGIKMARMVPGSSHLKSLIQLFCPLLLRNAAKMLLNHSHVPCWLDSGWMKKNDVKASFPDLPPAGGDALRHALKSSLLESGIPSLLRYEDRNSMHFSVESRVPFLVPEIAEFALSLPEDFLISDEGCTKRVLRKAFSGLVPETVLNRRDKIGFATPEGVWLRSRPEWVLRTLAPDRVSRLPMLKAEAVYALTRRFLKGEDQSGPSIWRLINFVLWSEKFEMNG